VIFCRIAKLKMMVKLPVHGRLNRDRRAAFQICIYIRIAASISHYTPLFYYHCR
jgi:hypothetical protein